MKLKKWQVKLLERVFDAEIEGRLLYSKDSRYRTLEFVRWVSWGKSVVGQDRFGLIIVEGWALTHLGRMLYCEWAAKEPDAKETQKAEAARPAQA